MHDWELLQLTPDISLQDRALIDRINFAGNCMTRSELLIHFLQVADVLVYQLAGGTDCVVVSDVRVLQEALL